MKYIIIVLLAVFSVSAQARPKVGQAGCGLGNQILGDEPGMIQVVAATSNGFYGNQTSGITSGTSNCLNLDGNVSLDAFVEANQIALNNDVSRGNGETVTTLGKMLSCQDQQAVNSTLKGSYQDIFSAEEPKAVSQKIRQALRDSEANCQKLG